MTLNGVMVVILRYFTEFDSFGGNTGWPKNGTIFVRLNKMLSYRRETALQDALVLAKSGRLELGDNILRTL